MILKTNSHSLLRCWSKSSTLLFPVVKSKNFIEGRYWSLAYRADRNRSGLGNGYWCYSWGTRAIAWHWSKNWITNI